MLSRSGNDDLPPIQAWSPAINQQVASIVQGVPPFPQVRGILESLQGRADAVVISQTPTEALEREWREHELVGLIRHIAGQEKGPHDEHPQKDRGGDERAWGCVQAVRGAVKALWTLDVSNYHRGRRQCRGGRG